jgi:endonuclease/exonuclease/phosphatase family metal-dependent hydrolase
MKLISLNIWGGRIHRPLLDFIEERKEVDIFCFQEIYHQAEGKMHKDDISRPNIFAELQKHLPQHIGFFRPSVMDWYGIGMFVKKDLKVLEEGEVNIYNSPSYSEYDSSHSRNLQWIKCGIGDKIYSVINVHGLWNGAGKTDTPDRIKQSKNIKDFISTLDNPQILCGDFNLRPDTQSMQILENGMINQIKKYNITSTRTSFYKKPEKFADYVLVSPDIRVNKFEVLPDEVSDHAALYLDFE